MGLLTLGNGPSGPTKKLWSSVGDWAAPVLVWLTFIGMLSAMISVLLGSDR
jgi:hypothetical protein